MLTVLTGALYMEIMLSLAINRPFQIDLTASLKSIKGVQIILHNTLSLFGVADDCWVEVGVVAIFIYGQNQIYNLYGT